ncbi:hypothetical protein G6F29_013384 [Rhizopus arrhizus]|nr:hypothetical protein G6F20_012474 [Rhizopus arrhizus]KAG0817161.1 hypothetical protein G6F19_012825 [Rhizopus arrhizus]KAG0820368.1 hypothetical protein G6F18_012663 [Rhizopus arrhizus]KAG0847039.1 hypothetical protein G6F17_012893 [Rhizopus arrhizus]KAG0862129.1 hypothetical protein G6F16_012765 [Rhizopus arrhizus]
MNTDFEMNELSLQQEEEEQTTEIYVSMMSMMRSRWVTAMDLDEEVNEELGALDSEENNYIEDTVPHKTLQVFCFFSFFACHEALSTTISSMLYLI